MDFNRVDIKSPVRIRWINGKEINKNLLSSQLPPFIFLNIPWLEIQPSYENPMKVTLPIVYIHKTWYFWSVDTECSAELKIEGIKGGEDWRMRET